MTKEKWIEHMESEGIVRPSKGGDVLTWKETQKAHKQAGCQDCKDRMKTIRANNYAKDRHESMTSLGLVRVKGNLGGTYYE